MRNMIMFPNLLGLDLLLKNLAVNTTVHASLFFTRSFQNTHSLPAASHSLNICMREMEREEALPLYMYYQLEEVLFCVLRKLKHLYKVIVFAKPLRFFVLCQIQQILPNFTLQSTKWWKCNSKKSLMHNCFEHTHLQNSQHLRCRQHSCIEISRRGL